ncbi:MAG: tRNA (adenine-N1)-methyltransferase [Actinomycetes bacterium]|jgi:tRNA (adenine57-N1/adenine58-N1)-methyltransferase
MTTSENGIPASRRGSFQYGDRVQLTDPKGKLHTINLVEGGSFHTHRGWIEHDLIVDLPEGSLVSTTGGTIFLALRPLYADFVLGMPRGATIVYPKDAAHIVTLGDIFPGARVVEAGAGSGALSIALLRAVGSTGELFSFEKRPEFAEVAAKNVEQFFGREQSNWHLQVGAVDEVAAADERVRDIDRVVFDMLAPWENIDIAAKVLRPGGVLICYVATTTQLSKVGEEIRSQGNFTEPHAWESMVRDWHLEGLAVRPEHRMIGHTGFLLTTRRLADGVTPPARRRRPSKGAYGVATEES